MIITLRKAKQTKDPDKKSDTSVGETDLQGLDEFKLVGVPLLDLLVLSRREEQMRLGDELQEHDAAGAREAA